MITRRDWNLKILGMTEWKIKNLVVLKGKITISLPKEVCFFIVSENQNLLNEIIVQDVLRTLCIMSNQVVVIRPDQLVTLPKYLCFNRWIIGCNRDLIPLGTKYIWSPEIEKIKQNSAFKRELWYQICNYMSSVSS